jgi:hypothetical protein
MRKIDLASYDTGLKTPDEQSVIFETRQRLIDILFVKPANGREILKRDKLATKIEAWPDDALLVEEEEYKLLVEGLDACQLSNRGFVEFARRVMDAQSVDVQAR